MGPQFDRHLPSWVRGRSLPGARERGGIGTIFDRSRHTPLETLNEQYTHCCDNGRMSVEIPRRSERKSVALGARCKTVDTLPETGRISDISIHGCCIRTRRDFLRVGTHVVIHPQGEDHLAGTVRWIAHDCAGVEFDHAIHDGLFDRLVRMHPPGSEISLSRG